VGAVQKLATVVIVGLVALATVLVLYLADENNRIKAQEQSQQDDAIERATQNYLSYCLRCHGPAGEGRTAPGEAGTGRIGAPLGGANTSLNQQGVYANGTPYPGGVDARATVIAQTITNGRTAVGMPAWGQENGGPLNDSQIEELTVMIQHVDWNEVYNEAIKMYGGYPTAEPAATPTPGAGATAAPTQGTAPPAGGGQASTSPTVNLEDIKFDPTAITIPANTDVTVTLVNKGATAHTFDIDALNIHSGEIQPGETKTITINAAAGSYQYYCAIPGHKEAGMVGTLTVQ
jgi:plastocyanin/mono/diheme cytochrome c family protein